MPPGEEALPEAEEDVAEEVVEETAETVVEPLAALPHEAGSERCSLANHHDGHGHCIRCLHCKVKVRPQHMGQPCPARNGESHVG